MDSNINEVLELENVSKLGNRNDEASPSTSTSLQDNDSRVSRENTGCFFVISTAIGAGILVLGLFVILFALSKDGFDDNFNLLAGILCASTGAGMIVASMIGKVLLASEANTYEIKKHLKLLNLQSSSESNSTKG